MNETEFRILDTLSRDPGRELSISRLTREIRRLHGAAHYANTYRALMGLQKQGVVHLKKTENTSLVSLDLKNRGTIDSLSEMELRRRHTLLEKREELQRLYDAFSDASYLGPISLIDAERNIKLNRAELLIQLPDWAWNRASTDMLEGKLEEAEGRLGIRIDALTLDDNRFRSLLAAQEKNPLKEMLSKHTTLLAPDLFWNQIRNAWAHGIQIRFDEDETNPLKISEQNLLYNLARFGYTEFGPQIKEGQDFGIEYVVIALLLRGDARRIRAIPGLLAKNAANYELILFLSKKYEMQSKLFGLLRALAKHKRDKDLESVLRILEKSGVKEIKTDGRSIEEMMRTSNALKRA